MSTHTWAGGPPVLLYFPPKPQIGCPILDAPFAARVGFTDARAKSGATLVA
jgi:hypothetical protein